VILKGKYFPARAFEDYFFPVCEKVS